MNALTLASTTSLDWLSTSDDRTDLDERPIDRLADFMSLMEQEQSTSTLSNCTTASGCWTTTNCCTTTCGPIGTNGSCGC